MSLIKCLGVVARGPWSVARRVFERLPVRSAGGASRLGCRSRVRVRESTGKWHVHARGKQPRRTWPLLLVLLVCVMSAVYAVYSTRHRAVVGARARLSQSHVRSCSPTALRGTELNLYIAVCKRCHNATHYHPTHGYTTTHGETSVQVHRHRTAQRVTI